MQKRILGTLLILCMALLLAPAAVLAEPTPITVTADKTVARPGDTITFILTMGAVDNMQRIVLPFNIPEELTFVDGAQTVAEGLKEKLSAKDVSFVSMPVFQAQQCRYTSNEDTVLGTFQCKVKSDAAPGSIRVDAYLVDADDFLDWSRATIPATFIPAVVEILAPLTPANSIANMPQTGDHSHMVLWIALLFVSGAGAIGAAAYGRKRRSAD